MIRRDFKKKHIRCKVYDANGRAAILNRIRLTKTVRYNLYDNGDFQIKFMTIKFDIYQSRPTVII